MHKDSPVTLRRVDPDANMRRQYSVSVISDLFGTPLVVCRWGRVGTVSQVREHACATIEEAEDLATRLVAATARVKAPLARDGQPASANPPQDHVESSSTLDNFGSLISMIPP